MIHLPGRPLGMTAISQPSYLLVSSAIHCLINTQSSNIQIVHLTMIKVKAECCTALSLLYGPGWFPFLSFNLTILSPSFPTTISALYPSLHQLNFHYIAEEWRIFKIHFKGSCMLKQYFPHMQPLIFKCGHPFKFQLSEEFCTGIDGQGVGVRPNLCWKSMLIIYMNIPIWIWGLTHSFLKL